MVFFNDKESRTVKLDHTISITIDDFEEESLLTLALE
jgi:hypothetical protein